MTTSLTEKEYYQLTISISKAFSSQEAPVKSKHVRAAIIATYHSNGGHPFWAIVVRQPLQDNRITAWKFCYVLHKILREGHPNVNQHSMRHRNMITEMGKLWGHLQDGYGLCIKQYSKLLVIKLEFHDRNPKFPGNLMLKRGELEKISGNDINVYFQLAIEMFDYLDEIVALQATIFNSIATFGVSSMSAPGQCRLQCLIPCIQDSNQLYDFVVRLMFLLHANLPDDLLSGHRERFRTLFRQLNNFYKQAGQLQYFVSLIKVPQLPQNPPNFLVQSDLGNYTAPVVIVPQDSESDTNSIVENLVDTTSPSEPEIPPRSKTPPPLPAIDFDRLLKERDELIRHLQQEVESNQRNLRSVSAEKQEYENKVQEHFAKINQELSQAKQELTNIRIEKEEIELKLQSAPILEQKAMAEEERAKSSEEKFQKLKNMYTQIRDEHIKLLRQHGEVSKQLAENTKLTSEASREKEEIKAKMQEIEAEKAKVQETMQQSSNETVKEREALADKIKALEDEKSVLLEKFQDVESNKSAEIAELKINLETLQKSLEELRENSLKLVEEKANLEQEYQAVVDKKNDVEQQTVASLEQLQNIVKEKAELEREKSLQQTENEALKQQVEEKTNENSILKENLFASTNEVDLLKKQVKEREQKLQENETHLTIISNEKHELEQLSNILKSKIEEMQDKSASEIENIRKSMDEKENSLQETLQQTETKFKEENLLLLNQINELQNLKEVEAEAFKNSLSELNDKKVEIEQKLQEVENQKTEFEELHSSALADLDALKIEKQNLEEANRNLTSEHEELKTEYEKCCSDFKVMSEKFESCQAEIENMNVQICEKDEIFKQLNANYDRVLNEKDTFETEIQDLLHLQEIQEQKNNEKIQQLETELLNAKIHGETSLRALLECVMKTSEKITLRAIAESETPGASGTPTYFIMIAEELQDVLTKLKLVHENYLKDNTNVEALARKVQTCGHLLASISEQGFAICNKSTNIDSGEKIASEIKNFGQCTSVFFSVLYTSSKSDQVNSQVDELKDKLTKITNMIGDLSNNNDDIDQLGDLVEKELSGMDKAIEEAAQKIVDMLAQTKTSDSGLKLEVNEKILDACTNLMRSIQILVQKSRKVQAEIIALGKGSASEKEFYKRNHQWTEGLISAARQIGNGANFLVDAANKATISGDKISAVVVAAQEIAACTAQLVVASRVKAPRSSQNLQELTAASKNVTQNTANVVATAKDCTEKLDEGQDLDFTKLSMHQAKTKEMEVQVKVLELEQALQQERMKLAALRRQNYQAAE